jgi:glycosyltransferase involved in cell wall biosynthesis
VIGPSQHVLDVHEKHGFFEGTSTKQIHPGIDGIAEDPELSEEDAILYVGKQQQKKGLETLFAAADRLPDVTFHICGTGSYDKRTAAVADERKNVIYHGFVPEERLQELRQEAAAAVVPSVWMEVYGLVITESFAKGLPVIGSDIGAIPELINPGETGFLFEPGDPDGLTSAIRRLLSQADRADLQRNVLAWAKERSMDAYINELLNEVYHL